jgi:hypothetical protein
VLLRLFVCNTTSVEEKQNHQFCDIFDNQNTHYNLTEGFSEGYPNTRVMILSWQYNENVTELTISFDNCHQNKIAILQSI